MVSAANQYQISGDHYQKPGAPQTWDVIIAWNLGYLEGNAVKYISRWKDKGGVADLKKAIHYLEKLIEVTEAGEAPKDVNFPRHLRDPAAGKSIPFPPAVQSEEHLFRDLINRQSI